jgi:3-hydroxybutyryl-CoA dehydrogenase
MSALLEQEQGLRVQQSGWFIYANRGMLDTDCIVTARRIPLFAVMPDRERGPVGLVGLGLMGRGIATCLIAHGYSVVGVDPGAGPRKKATTHVAGALHDLRARKRLSAASLRGWESRFQLGASVEALKNCWLVLECIPEDLQSKRTLYKALEQVVSARTIIASNTSSLPITLLQQGQIHPRRFVGMHWGEPAQILHYLEIIPGKQTSPAVLRAAERFGLSCGKEPTILKQDIRGFLSNRLMYAMIREACHLVECGIADIETVDRSFRNDIGWWATLAGPFRWMDLTGIPAYAAVMEGLLPELSNSTDVPDLMRKMTKSNAHGIQNQRGFYNYTRKSAQEWERRWVEFTYDIEQVVKRHQA